MWENFYFNKLLVYVPWLFSILLLVVLFIRCFLSNIKLFSWFKKVNFKWLIWLLIICGFLFNTALTFTQYFIWHRDTFGHFFLPPYQPWSYFISYTFMHFWLSDILALISAGAFYLILELYRKLRSDVIKKDELNLILIACLLLGWPRLILFIPLFLVLAVIHTALNLVFFKKPGISLFPVIFISLITLFLLGSYFVLLAKLSSLII